MVRIKKRGARAAGGPKQKQQKRLFKKVQVNAPEIAKHWDPRRSRGANLARMGLSDDANRAGGVPGAAPSRVEVAQEVKLRLVAAPQPARRPGEEDLILVLMHVEPVTELWLI